MTLYLALRYSFSRSSNHRARAIRIVVALSLSLAVFMVTMSVMEYLQAGRFDRIRDAKSFDITITGDYAAEMKERFPSSDVFVYGETEVLGNGDAYTLRYIDENYSGALSVNQTGNGVLLVPYTYTSSDSMAITELVRGASGAMIPSTKKYGVWGRFFTSLGSSFDSTFIFLPLSLKPEGVPVYTAIKNCDAEELEGLSEDGYEGESWKEKEAGLYSAFIIERIMMYVVLSLLFIIILVALRQSVRSFFNSRNREIAELITLGLERRKADLAFIISMSLIIVAGIVVGLILSYLFIPVGELYVSSLLGGKAELDIPYLPFLVISFLMLFFSALFSHSEESRLKRTSIMEVLGGE